MNFVRQSPKTAAILVTLLMALPITPGAYAQSVPDVPRIPGLPLPGPGAHCVDASIATPDAMGIANALATGNTAYFAQQNGRPVLCDQSGQPLAQYATLMAAGKDIIAEYNTTAQTLQQQADDRDRATIPRGDILRPEVTLLKDDFSGNRVGGIGDWTVVTQHGEAAAIALIQTTSANGTRGEYRFGSDDGYARGIHQWLVSPEMDLAALNANADLLSSLLAAERYASTRLDAACYGSGQGSTSSQVNVVPTSDGALSSVCGKDSIPDNFVGLGLGVVPSEYTRPGDLILAAYHAQLDSITRALPIVQRAASLDFDYRFNLAKEQDGVRVWIYSGERAPDRAMLSEVDTFGVPSGQVSCYTDTATTASGGTVSQRAFDPEGAVCRGAPRGGTLLGQPVGLNDDPYLDNPIEGMADTGTFDHDAPLHESRFAFTGDHPSVGRAHIDLTNFTNQRIWLLFEVKSEPDGGRGSDQFADKGLFPRSNGFGFELLRVNATGQAHYRNVRAEDIGQNLPLAPVGNPFHDDTDRVRILAPGLPLGRAPLMVHVENAGTENENATLKVGYQVYDDAGNLTTSTTIATLRVLNLSPSEVRPIAIPVSANLTPGTLMRFTATLAADDLTTNNPDLTSLNTTKETRPGATAVRFPNSAVDPTGKADATKTFVDVRAYARHALTALRAYGAGPALDVCSSISQLQCTQSNAAKKGEPRLMQVAVRNDGSQPETITAQLLFTLDGVDRSSVILDAAARTLADVAPGEIRVVTWTVVPSEPGIYDAVAVFQTPDTTTTAARQVYVQRSTGLICYDDLAADRECSPSFSLSQPDFLKGQDITAGIEVPEGLLIATQVDQKNGALYLRGPDGAWNTSATMNISNGSLVAARLPVPQPSVGFGSVRTIFRADDGTLYLAGDNATLLRINASGRTSIPLNKSTAIVSYDSLAWWNGTLIATAESGTIFRWNQTAKEMQPTALNVSRIVLKDGIWQKTMPPSTLTTVPIHALLVQGPRLYAATDVGIFYNNSSNLSAPWVNVTMDNADVGAYTTLGILRGQLYAGGANGIIVRASPATPTVFTRVPSPVIFGNSPIAALFGAPDAAGVADESIWAIDTAGHIATCVVCDPAAMDWTYPALPIPLVGKPAHAGAMRAIAGGYGEVSILGEGGYLLDYGHGSTRYSNAEDWSVTPLLYAKDGAIEFIDSQSITAATKQAYRGNLSQSVSGFTKFRVVADHFILNTSGGATGTIRIVFTDVPSGPVGHAGTDVYTCPRASGTFDDPTKPDAAKVTSGGLGDVCHFNGTVVRIGSIALQDLANFTNESRDGSWQRYDSGEIAASPLDRFTGVEFLAEGNIRWAIDDVHVYGFNGTWNDLLWLEGPTSRSAGSVWAPRLTVADATALAQQSAQSSILSGSGAGADQVDAGSHAANSTTNQNTDAANGNLVRTDGKTAANAVNVSAQSSVLDDHSTFWVPVETPFYASRASIWHISPSGDAPIWVANDEVTNPSAPRLHNGQNARLVSPVLDLRSAYDPVITFDQTYAFRTYSYPKAGTSFTEVAPGDAGWLELQYLRQGPDECPPPATSETTCGWSSFYKIHPDGGYPSATALGLGTYSVIAAPSGSRTYLPDTAASKGAPSTGPSATKPQTDPGHAYWYRTALPDERGIITGGQHPETYTQTSITLDDVTCKGSQTWNVDDCIPYHIVDNQVRQVNLSGHLVRLGFHIETQTNVSTGDNYFDYYTIDALGVRPAVKFHTSYPGEGWYITNLKVAGASKLGIDLKASNLDFRVGYDPIALGRALNTNMQAVGPGTRVPVNVTITNAGAFDVLGYTGALEVRRIVDPVLRTTQLVQTISLAQQPLIEPGQSVNHTFAWDVPSTPGELYTLTFRATPLGIDRDEDPTDNVLTLGTFATPVLAKAKSEFSVEVRVTPQNASSEIVRSIPIFIRNTGNMPIGQLTITRTITDAVGIVGVPLVFHITRPVPQGTRVSLAAVADVDPASDLFWQAPENKQYKVLLLGESPGLPSATASSPISALDTFFFDDVEGGARGESFRGAWNFSAGWGAPALGFRSSSAYAFGEPAAERYPNGADASATLPTIEIGSARDAKIALYHRYDLEAGFDGFALQASADDGKTWTTVPPLADDPDGLPQGVITTTPLAATSALHPTGDPEDTTYVFSGDSATLPTQVGGWVLSQFDLTSFSNVTKTNVSYSFFRNPALRGYSNVSVSNTTLPSGIRNDAIWYDSSFALATDPAGLAARRFWEIQNLTGTAGARNGELLDNGIVPPAASGASTVWWSGSPSYEDDQKLASNNQMLNVPVTVTGMTERTKVVLDWWEWTDRFDQVEYHLQRGADRMPKSDAEGFYDAMGYTGRGATATMRLNVSQPSIVGQVGRWYHMSSDITAIARAENGSSFNVSFIYAPRITAPGTAITPTDYASRLAAFGLAVDDRGFAIAGFRVVSSTEGSGSPPVTILDARHAWDNATLLACIGDPSTWGPSGTANWVTPNTLYPPCYRYASGVKYDRKTDGSANYAALTKGNMTTPALVGTVWSEVTAAAIPALPSSWATVPIMDRDGKGNVLATQTNDLGELPYAWYTGSPGDAGCRSITAGDLYTAKGILYKMPCPVPGSESRLVMPMMDLTRVAGENAFLTFDQRYDFYVRQAASYDYPIASGGVVEAQVLDEATGTWGPWTQIYTGNDMRTFPLNPDKTPIVASDLTIPLDGQALDVRGGYSMFTVNQTATDDGTLVHADPPFAPVHPPTRNAVIPQDVQYLYSGQSGSAAKPWVQARFDVSDLLGHKVRFGFHVFFSGATAASQKGAQMSAPNGPGSPDEGGWWITNVSLTGDVLSGKSVQLRLRAATDDNVNDGHWQFDDIGVFGKRYGRNVELEADASQTLSTIRGHNATLPITVTNLGDAVRRGLAVRAQFATINGQSFGAPLGGFGDAGAITTPTMVTLLAPPLAPGQSTTLQLNVSIDKNWGAKTDGVLLLEMRESNPTSPLDPYVAIADNEVQGFLTKQVRFHVDERGNFTLESPVTSPVPAKVGTPVDVAITVRNVAGSKLTGALDCTAEVVDHHVTTNHEITPGIEANVDRMPLSSCGSVSVSMPLAGTQVVHFHATPTAAGVMQFHLASRVLDENGAPVLFQGYQVSVGVDAPVQALTNDFTSKADVETNWTGTQTNPVWSYIRGHNAAGALVLGADDNSTSLGYAHGVNGLIYEATTRTVDLHNFTAQDAYLTIWHQDRMAVGDGADVHALVTLNEVSGNSATSYVSCKLYPIGGYDGNVSEMMAPTINNRKVFADSPNPAFKRTEAEPSDTGVMIYSPGKGYFTNGLNFEDGWTKTVFDLRDQPACWNKDYTPSDGAAGLTQKDRDALAAGPISLLGHEVRFVFDMYAGGDTPTTQGGVPQSRFIHGTGHGFLLDDVSVGPYNLDVRPVAGQRALLLDNVTKSFNVVVTNRGDFSDIARLRFEGEASSAPPEAVRVPADAITLAPHESKLVPVIVTLPRDPSLLPTTYRIALAVDSVLDAAVGSATSIELVFAPRQLADLGVTVTPPAGSVQEGTEAFIPITVENHGLIDSLPSRITVTDEWVGHGPAVPIAGLNLALPAIHSYYTNPDESSLISELHWKPERGAVGAHILTFIADPDGVAEEYSRVDNVVRVPVVVSPLLIPDLDVANASVLRIRNAQGGLVPASQDADVLRYEVTAGELVSFELKVLNTGRAAATGVDVRASIGSLTLPAKSIAFIPAGGQVVTTFNWLAQKGEYNLTFDVRLVSEDCQKTTDDPDGKLCRAQLSLDNDHYPAKGLTLLTVKDFEIGIDLPSLPTDLVGGTDVKVPFNVTNTGNAGEDLAFVTDAPPGVVVTLSRDGLFLRQGETFTGTMRVHIGDDAVTGGEAQFIRVLAVSRENPMKVASAQTPLSVKAEYAGSLVSTVATAAPPVFEVPIVARNEGNSLAPWTIRATLPPGWVAAETLPAKLVVPPHGSATLVLHVRAPTSAAPGPQLVGATATMPDGQTRQATITVGVQSLRAATAHVAGSDAKAVEGALAYAVTVENAGNTRSPFEMVLTGLPAGISAKMEPAVFDLAPGAKTVATLTVTPDASVATGAYPITGYTLFQGVTPDTAEGRANKQTLSVTIERPDLGLSTLEYAPRQGLSVGDRVTVRLPVTNHGAGPIADVPVHLFVDDVFVAESRIAALAPGEKSEVSFNWTALPGQHTLTAVADPYNDTVDPARVDNAVSALVTVGASSATGGLAAERAKVPGLGALGAMAAVLAVALVLSVTPRKGSRRPPK